MGEEVPKWAQPLSPKLFKEFQIQVLATYAELNTAPEIDWELGKAKIDPLEIFFHNLIVKWREADDPGKLKLVQKYLVGTLQALDKRQDLLKDRLDDLLIRIYDLEIPHIENLVSKPIGNFLFATLVLDSPTNTVSVTRDQFKESGRDLDELFDIAKKNLGVKVKPSSERRLAPFGELTFVTAEYFGASFITHLEPVAEPEVTYWVATPNRHTLLVLKPNSHDNDTLFKFLELANRFSKQIPNDYILPFVLEFKDGVFRDLCKRVDGGIEIA